MKERLCRVKGVFKGIYKWGTGYVSDRAYEEWEKFWSNPYLRDGNKPVHCSPIYWHTMKDNFGTFYAVAVQGSIYLHPMSFSAVLCNVGGHCETNGVKEYFSELNELKELCEIVAENCGGTFEFSRTEKEVEFD